jgi:hypothetical protein
MLLPSLQAQTKRPTVETIFTYPDQTTREFPFIRIGTSEERSVRAAKAHWHAKALGGAYDYVGVECRRGFKECQGEEICRTDELSSG